MYVENRKRRVLLVRKHVPFKFGYEHNNWTRPGGHGVGANVLAPIGSPDHHAHTHDIPSLVCPRALHLVLHPKSLIATILYSVMPVKDFRVRTPERSLAFVVMVIHRMRHSGSLIAGVPEGIAISGKGSVTAFVDGQCLCLVRRR
jgi:hypothetical protein